MMVASNEAQDNSEPFALRFATETLTDHLLSIRFASVSAIRLANSCRSAP